MDRPPSLRERYLGCLLGGAVGDALGAPVEFLSLSAIRARLGAEGVLDFLPAYDQAGGAFTDDTQMTLFTAEGLLRAGWDGMEAQRREGREACWRWLTSQGYQPGAAPPDWQASGGLLALPALHEHRGPGNTCLSSLRATAPGSLAAPPNDSKGCGGVMRMAPVGLLSGGEDSFRLGCELAAITHGHPSGYLAAGFLAQVVRDLVQGKPLPEAVAGAQSELRRWEGHEECLRAVEAALALAAQGAPTAEKVESLGEGWVAEEALAIGLYGALVAEDFAHGVLLAVNHGGDSDSTGAIAGNLLGALLGTSAIPARWREDVELADEVTRLAEALARAAREQR